MQKIKLNKDFGQIAKAHEYELDPTKEYVINFEDEMEEQMGIMTTTQTMGLPALEDYDKWLSCNGFSLVPTNDFVSKFYGVKSLWNTDFSQGIVVKTENNDDYYIVVECSRLNEGFIHKQVVVTLGGCL